jgi:hypothetical protein
MVWVVGAHMLLVLPRPTLDCSSAVRGTMTDICMKCVRLAFWQSTLALGCICDATGCVLLV